MLDSWLKPPRFASVLICLQHQSPNNQESGSSITANQNQTGKFIELTHSKGRNKNSENSTPIATNRTKKEMDIQIMNSLVRQSQIDKGIV